MGMEHPSPRMGFQSLLWYQVWRGIVYSRIFLSTSCGIPCRTSHPICQMERVPQAFPQGPETWGEGEGGSAVSKSASSFAPTLLTVGLPMQQGSGWSPSEAASLPPSWSTSFMMI